MLQWRACVYAGGCSEAGERPTSASLPSSRLPHPASIAQVGAPSSRSRPGTPETRAAEGARRGRVSLGHRPEVCAAGNAHYWSGAPVAAPEARAGSVRGRGNSAAPAAPWRKAAGRLRFRWRRRLTTTRPLCCSPAGSCIAPRSPATAGPVAAVPCVCELRPHGHERQRRCGAGAERRGWASCVLLSLLSPIPGPGHVPCGWGGGPGGQALRVPREEAGNGLCKGDDGRALPAHLLFYIRTRRLQEEEA